MAVRLPRVSRRSQSGLPPGGGGPERYISARRAGSARRSYRDQLREIINHVATLDKFKSGFGNTPLRLAVEARPIGQTAGIGRHLAVRPRPGYRPELPHSGLPLVTAEGA